MLIFFCAIATKVNNTNKPIIDLGFPEYLFYFVNVFFQHSNQHFF